MRSDAIAGWDRICVLLCCSLLVCVHFFLCCCNVTDDLQRASYRSSPPSLTRMVLPVSVDCRSSVTFDVALRHSASCISFAHRHLRCCSLSPFFPSSPGRCPLFPTPKNSCLNFQHRAACGVYLPTLSLPSLPPSFPLLSFSLAIIICSQHVTSPSPPHILPPILLVVPQDALLVTCRFFAASFSIETYPAGHRASFRSCSS